MIRGRRSGSFLLAALGLALAGPAAAKVGAPPSLPQPGQPAPPAGDAIGEDEYRTLLTRALGFIQADDCPHVFTTLDPVLPRVTGRQRVFVQLLRIPCLGAVGRGNEIKRVYDEIVAISPADGMVRGVGVVVAAMDGQYVEAGQRLAVLAEENPDQLSGVTGDVGRGILQELTQGDQFALRDRIFIALARADWQPADRPDLRDSLAQGAIDALLTQDRVEDARALLPRITMPELLASMAMERHYAPLWPTIEARLGDHGGRAIDRFVAARLTAFSTSPDDERVVRDAVRSFILLGRFGDAAETGEHVMVRDGMSEDAVSIARYRAQALAAAGDRAGGIASLRGFAALDLARTPDAVSGLVGLAEMLDENGQADDALNVARQSLARGQAALSPWGAAWLKRTEVCALGSLGRRDEAGRLADTLLSHASDNEAATIEALLCIGRGDEAARLAIATLGTTEGASRLADQFQPESALWAPSPSRLRALWTGFLQRPDVRRAFERSARILPQSLWPAREPRAIPRVAPDEDSPPTT